MANKLFILAIKRDWYKRCETEIVLIRFDFIIFSRFWRLAPHKDLADDNIITLLGDNSFEEFVVKSHTMICRMRPQHKVSDYIS